jgi:hypothetical protein
MSSTKPKISEERFKQETALTATFFQVLQNRVDELAKGKGSTKFELEEPERRVLLRINNSGLLKGAAAGILTLVLLRRVRSSVLNRVVQKVQEQQQQRNGNVGNSPFQQQSLQHPIPPLSTNTPLQEVLRRRQNPWSLPNLLGWFLDVSVSFFVGATSSFLLTDRKMVLRSVSELPLIEGKSRVAAELCPNMLDQYHKLLLQNSEHQPEIAEVLRDPQTEYLKAIKAFCVNCQRRKVQEDRLRATMGMDPTSVVAIPPPGVTVSEDDVDLWQADHGQPDASRQPNADTGDFYEPMQDNDSARWSDDFVTDQADSDGDRP